MQLTLLGGTGTLMGSKYLVTEGNAKVLADWGLLRGYKQLRLRYRGLLRLSRRTYRRTFSPTLTSTLPATYSSVWPNDTESAATHEDDAPSNLGRSPRRDVTRSEGST